jgi:hypothetical protein
MPANQHYFTIRTARRAICNDTTYRAFRDPVSHSCITLFFDAATLGRELLVRNSSLVAVSRAKEWYYTTRIARTIANPRAVNSVAIF